MAKQPQQPQATDAILDGQAAPPLTGAVLGGHEGLQQRFLHLDTELKLAVMPSILELGEPGIDLLIAVLHDDAIAVRLQAYQVLRNVDSEKAKSAISDGVLVNPGDRIYCVYKSAVSFDDEFFHLEFHLETNLFEEYGSFEDSIQGLEWQEMGYESYEGFYEDLLDDYQSHVPQRKSRHLSKAEAERAAELLHQQLVWEWDEQDYNACFDTPLTFHNNLQEWCAVHRIDWDRQLTSAYALSDWLKASRNRELLAKLWKDAIGCFAFVQEEVVSESQYLKW